MAAKPTDVVGVTVRIREKLRRSLEVEAKRQGRSMNKEIESRLQGSLNRSAIDQVIELAAQRAVTAQTEAIMARLNAIFAILGGAEYVADQKAKGGNTDV